MTATLSDGAMLDPLDFYFVEWPEDPAALDAHLVHECGRVICDVEHTDTLATLVRTVLAHEFSGCGPYPRTDGTWAPGHAPSADPMTATAHAFHTRITPRRRTSELPTCYRFRRAVGHGFCRGLHRDGRPVVHCLAPAPTHRGDPDLI